MAIYGSAKSERETRAVSDSQRCVGGGGGGGGGGAETGDESCFKPVRAVCLSITQTPPAGSTSSPSQT